MTKLKIVILCTICVVLGIVSGVSLSRVKVSPPTTLVVTGNTAVSKGGLIDLTANVENPSWFLTNTIYQWKVLHNNGELPFRSVTANNILLPAGLNNDKVFVILSAVNYHNYIAWGSVSPLDTKVIPVTVGDAPAPGPGPIPPVPPTPPAPTPITDPLWAIAVFDNTAALTWTPDQLKLHNSTTVVAATKALNVTWKNYDKANPALADPTWQAEIAKVGLPALFLMDVKGKTYYSGKAISETDAVIQINIVRGGK